MDNKKRGNFVERQVAFVKVGASQIKISTLPKEIPLHSYAIGCQRLDRETKETYFAPFVQHEDLPAVIEELRRIWEINEAALVKAKAAAAQEYQKEETRASSWKLGKEGKKLRKLHKQGRRSLEDNPKARVDSERERQKNAETFAGNL
jgi:hypothetical protein